MYIYLKDIYIYECVYIYKGLAEKFVWVFPRHLTENLNKHFGYNESLCYIVDINTML